jgi:Kef-type K+ transport system membrane component KefB
MPSGLIDPLSQLLLQLVTVLVAARVAGRLVMRLGQPAVIGEMAVGICLGPSLLGWAAPGVFHALFPASSLPTLQLISQIGVCLFLFVVGISLDTGHARRQAPAAALISTSSIVLPALLGGLTSLLLYPALAGDGAAFVPFALFMAIAMGITAFPVLARILEERRIARTPLGTLAITCAAAGDVAAWVMLAGIVAISQDGGWGASITTIALSAVFVGVMLMIVRPAVAHWAARVPQVQQVLVVALAVMLLSALTTEAIGIHALFGAFLAGVVMPRSDAVRQHLTLRIDDFATVFLLPLFFVFTGLRTSITLLNDSDSWLICLGLIAVATLGKLGGTMAAARWTGMRWPDAFALGALMNTRGLMELIALNIGYDLGILSPEIFAMLVIMALVTTAMTGPLLTLAGRWQRA